MSQRYCSTHYFKRCQPVSGVEYHGGKSHPIFVHWTSNEYLLGSAIVSPPAACDLNNKEKPKPNLLDVKFEPVSIVG
jgi:hypothetical protein